MKRRVLAILLAVFLIVSLVACGGSKTSTESTKAPEASAEGTATTGTGAGEAETPSAREEGSIVVASDDFNERFTPFFASSVQDRAIGEVFTQAPFIMSDKTATHNSDGLAECDWQNPEIKENGEVVYKVKLKDNVKTPDGQALTVDDVIFNAKVYLDPTYDGNATLYASSLVGANEYKYDDANYAENLKKIDEEVAAYTPSAEEIKAKAKALVEEVKSQGGDATEESFLEGGENYEDTLAELSSDKKNELTVAYINKNLEDGIDYPEIEGMVKIDDYNMELHFAYLNPRNLDNFTFAVVPKSYYGQDFKKGNLDTVKAKDKEPFGAGPYQFKSFKNNVVSLESNPNYYMGEPKIKKLKVQVIDNTNKLAAVGRGDMDVADPTASPDMMKEAEKYENVHTELIDNNGYGYIGVNCERLSDKNVRKGIFHLLDRKPAVEAAFGELASVIERPMSRVNWAYPENATEYYGFNTEKALEYFKAAGYEQVDGKLVKDGKQLTIGVAYPGGNSDDHPVKPVFSKLKEEGEKLGMKVNLQNMDGGPFFAAMDAGQLDMWAAAWQAVPDPDMTQVYKSTSAGNKYHVANAELDKLIDEGLKTMDREKRKEIYAQAMDIVMDEACEMPFYQRKNMNVFNKNVIDIDTLPEELTPYWSWNSQIETLELAQ